MTYKKILTWACTAALFLTGCTTDTGRPGGFEIRRKKRFDL